MARSTAARAGPSQSQSQRPTQTQKTRGHRQVVEPDSSEEESEDEEDGVQADENSTVRLLIIMNRYVG